MGSCPWSDSRGYKNRVVKVDKPLKPGQKREWKKGCCGNCGSSTHKIKECVDRPRKRGARAEAAKKKRGEGSAESPAKRTKKSWRDKVPLRKPKTIVDAVDTAQPTKEDVPQKPSEDVNQEHASQKEVKHFEKPEISSE